MKKKKMLHRNSSLLTVIILFFFYVRIRWEYSAKLQLDVSTPGLENAFSTLLSHPSCPPQGRVIQFVFSELQSQTMANATNPTIWHYKLLKTILNIVFIFAFTAKVVIMGVWLAIWLDCIIAFWLHHISFGEKKPLSKQRTRRQNNVSKHQQWAQVLRSITMIRCQISHFILQKKKKVARLWPWFLIYCAESY